MSFREEFGNIWDIECDALCITTNGTIKNDGTAVMGRGVAKQAKDRFHGIAKTLGMLLEHDGNVVNEILFDTVQDRMIYSFPVKHEWFEMADINLIKRSCGQLMVKIVEMGYKKVLLPRPGCGNGQLHWAFVKSEIYSLLNERIVVVDREPDASN